MLLNAIFRHFCVYPRMTITKAFFFVSSLSHLSVELYLEFNCRRDFVWWTLCISQVKEQKMKKKPNISNHCAPSNEFNSITYSKRIQSCAANSDWIDFDVCNFAQENPYPVKKSSTEKFYHATLSFGIWMLFELMALCVEHDDFKFMFLKLLPESQPTSWISLIGNSSVPRHKVKSCEFRKCSIKIFGEQKVLFFDGMKVERLLLSLRQHYWQPIKKLEKHGYNESIKSNNNRRLCRLASNLINNDSHKFYAFNKWAFVSENALI